MKRLIISIFFMKLLFSQAEYTVPFDWSGQNGFMINDGALFWNRSWTSGVLLFDGTYSSYPERYGRHTSNKFNPLDIGSLPVFNDLPDTSNINTHFNYNRGDYNFDQLSLNATYESKDQYININGFKRSDAGNTGHYFHPSGRNSPIHHSYRIDYGVKHGKRQVETSIGRYITNSGLPDSTQNGLENGNIISAGLKVSQSVGNWKINSHFANFMQHRLINHSSFIDSNYRDINRTLINIQLEIKNGRIFGIQNQSQNISSSIHNRSLQWTKIYGQLIFKNFSILGGVQLLNSDDTFPFIWEISHDNKYKNIYYELSSKGSPSPKHPDLDDPNDNSSFDYWNRSSLKFGVTLLALDLSVFLNSTQTGMKAFEGHNIFMTGGNITYSHQSGWSIFSNIVTQVDSSVFGGGGTFIKTGINGKVKIFSDNMIIDLKLWSNTSSGRKSSFGYNPLLQIPFENSNSQWIIEDSQILNFEANADISGVIISYKINNILNAIGTTNEKAWFRPNHLYPQLGRMVQFGVTWYFNN
jgi:hypothetical protein|tara:strand:- start:1268 stop:2845 length:1578 start_codon:yes stop_codon:yes gene_type:complete